MRLNCVLVCLFERRFRAIMDTMDTQRDQKPIVPVQSPPGVSPQGGAVRGEHEVAGVAAPHPDGLVVPSEQEIVLHPEVEKAGVRVVPPNPQLTSEDREAGLSHSGPQLPVQDAPTAVQLPSARQIEQDRRLPVDDKGRWLAEMYKKLSRVFKKAA